MLKMEKKNMATFNHQKLLKIFPWINDIKREFSRSFPSDYQEHTLDLLNQKIQNELKECLLPKRAKYLYEMLGYFYNHFCWKVKWNESSQNMQVTCVQILANLIKVGIFLCQGDIKSEWLNRILAAIMIFSGSNNHLYTAILCVNVLKKKHLNVYSTILRNVLCFNHVTTKEPVEYLKVILLFRRLKSLVKDPIRNDEITFAFAKVKPPASLKSWLWTHDFEILWHVKPKIMLKKLMRKSLDKFILRRLREAILPEVYLEKISSKRKVKQRNLEVPVLSVTESIKQVQTESKMILADNNESSEVISLIVKKSRKKRKLNQDAMGQENVIKLTNVENEKEISETNARAKKKRRKESSNLINNIQIESDVQENYTTSNTVMKTDCSKLKTKLIFDTVNTVRKSSKSIESIETINLTHSDDDRPSNFNDVNKDSIEQKESNEEKHISDYKKSIKHSNNFELHDETSSQENFPGQTQATNKSIVLLETESCSPSVIGNEFKNVVDVDVKDLMDDKDTLNLQKETKDEIIKNCEMKDEAIVEETGEAILEYVGLRRIPILPVLESSLEKNLLNDYDSSKLISVKHSEDVAEIKSGNYSDDINKSRINIAKSNSDQVIEDCSLKNTEYISQSSYGNPADTLSNTPVTCIMEKMLKHLEELDCAVEDCSFETVKHGVFKGAIKITPDKLMNHSNSKSPLLKKAHNLLSFFDVSLERSRSNELKNVTNADQMNPSSEVPEFSFYRDLIHDLDDNKSEDTLSANLNPNKIDADEFSSDGSNKIDTNEFSSDDCSYDSDVGEINENPHDCNSPDRPDTFHLKDNNSDSTGQDFTSTSKESQVKKETYCHMHENDISEKDNINSVEEYSNLPKVDSTMKSEKSRGLSPVVNLGRKCDSSDFSKNNSKILNCVDSAAQSEFDMEAKNSNYSDPESLTLQENQSLDCDLHKKIIEDINQNKPFVILSNICCVKEPSNPKIHNPQSPLHLTDNQIEISLSSVNDFTKSENAESQNQVHSCNSELTEHNSVIEPSMGRILRQRNNQTTSLKKSVPSKVVEEIHIKSSDSIEVETPVKLACYQSLRNGNTTPSSKNLSRDSIESLSSTSSSIRRSSKRLKREVNQNLGLAFSVLSLDSPKTKKCLFNESSMKNIPEEELKDLVPVDSETKTHSTILNKEKEKSCQKSRLSKAIPKRIDDSQKSSNQKTDSKGYNLRTRSIIMPGKLKL